MLTLDQLNKHVESVNIDEMQIPHARGIKATPEEIMGKICGVYQKARPILEFLANFGWIIPQKWRDIIKAFIAQFDKICPPA